jgi:hypothetical protein
MGRVWVLKLYPPWSLVGGTERQEGATGWLVMDSRQGRATISNAGKPKPGLAPVLMEGRPEPLHTLSLLIFGLQLSLLQQAPWDLQLGSRRNSRAEGKPFLRG